jgi:hypothetical protein
MRWLHDTIHWSIFYPEPEIPIMAHDLARLLVQPRLACELSLRAWNDLLPQARHHGMLGLLAERLDTLGALPGLPLPVRPHLEAALTTARENQRMVCWEVNRIRRALADTDVPITLLKGAAYLLAGLPMAQGRLVSDVDILIPRASLDTVEQTLLSQGWAMLKQDDYDQQYYRRWMHELPPLRHKLRGTVVDVHHNILPETSRLHPDPTQLLAASEELEPGLRVLCPADMVLHSAAHGFHDGEFGNSLRDLLDLHELVSHFAGMDGFWSSLLNRSRVLDLQRPLYYGLRYATRFLGTVVPSRVVHELAIGGPGPWTRGVMDRLFPYTLPDTSATPLLAPLARQCLYIRAHWLRMPPILLLRHLSIKALRRTRAPG